MTIETRQPRRAYIDLPHGQLHYREIGEGDGEPLLLLHQTPSSGLQWEAAYPRLAAAGLRVIAPDTPGYGMSDPLEVTPTAEGFAGAALALLDALEVPRAAVLGHHTGAVSACALARAQPERVSRLVLNGVPFFTAEQQARYLSRLPEQAPAIEEDGSHLLEPWTRRLGVTKGYSDLRAMTRCVIEMLQVRQTEWHGYIPVFTYDMEEALRALTVPTLLFTNTGEDLYRSTQRAREARPDLAYMELDGGTHDIVDEQPDAWVAAVLDFVRG
jgi:pimeloyl-ACP methyl ester carboxylesterase